MDEDDLDDTVAVSPRPAPVVPSVFDEDTVIRDRPRAQPVEVDEDTIIGDRVVAPIPSVFDGDTVIRERRPFADVPAEAFAAIENTVVPHPLVEPAPATRADREDATVEAVQAQTEAPPSYGFVIGDHEPIPLDIPAYIGRRPASPRISAGRPPRLVRVPSPLQEVSSTHLEVRQHGASVLVTDLKSTNGTIVSIPGVAPLKLRQGESVVVLPGTLVDIGDGNILQILPLQRFRLPGPPSGERRTQ